MTKFQDTYLSKAHFYFAADVKEEAYGIEAGKHMEEKNPSFRA